MATPPGDNQKRPDAEEREMSAPERAMSAREREPTEEQSIEPWRTAERLPAEEPIGWETDTSDEEMDMLGGRPPTSEAGGALRRDWSLVPRMLPYLRPYGKLAAASVAVTILVALVVLAEPWPLAFVIDGVLGEDPVPGWVTAIVGDGVGALIVFAVIATLVLTLLSGGLTVVNEYLTTKVNQYMTLDFRSDLVQHVQRLSFSYHDSARTGVLMYRLNQQSGAIGQIVTGLPAIAQSVLTIAGMAFITFTIDPLLALIALGVTPFIFYSTNFYANRIEPRLYTVRGLEAMNLAIVHEIMQMFRVVLAFGRERREYWRFRNQGEKAVKARVDLTVRQTAFQLGVQLITAIGTAAVLGVGAHLAVKGRITAGELLVVLTYVAQVYQPMEEVTQTIASYQQQFIAFRHASDLLKEAPHVTEKPDARAIERARGEIELDGVEFSYPKQRKRVLKDIGFRVPAGQAVALVGPTGAGKSTLASLLPRFYDPDEGRVLIDGIDLRDLTLDSARGQFSIVLQEPLLFQTSILENIRYGKHDATDEEVEAAAKAANAHEFITELPDGYETTLGERGAQISGGERQRIAVARAFLRDAPILILDEPTSSIDSRTESAILDALDRLMEGRTTIMIAHRLSTLRDVDRILVLDEGRLVEQGTHDELLAVRGLYRRMWEAQTGREGVEMPGTAPDAVALSAPSSDGPDDDAGALQEGERESQLRELMQRIDEAERRERAARARTRAALDRIRQPAAGTRGREPGGPSRPKVVLLGMLTRIPVAGVAWQVGQYVAGFERLGYEVYYVEAHGRTPMMLMTHKEDDGAGKAARYVAEFAARFGLGDRWSYQALHDKGQSFGMSPERLDRVYRDAALIVNMHGGTRRPPEHAATDRLVFLGTDPVDVELDVHRGRRQTIEFLDQHVAFFTSALNYGNPECKLPWASSFPFVPSPPPVVLEFWDNDVDPDGAPFTTIGNWRQHRSVRFDGRVYRWSKHHEFLKILDLPIMTRTPIELALGSYDDHDHLLLAEHGWRVRPGYELSRDPDTYRDYIIGSAGEVSAAKEQNIHFRSGWFSERSATYLAAGRPVILQDTGFGVALPTGEGLFAFDDLKGAAEAINAVRRNPKRHRRVAREIAREYLSHEVVLGDMLDRVGLGHRPSVRPRRRSPAAPRIPGKLPLNGRSGRPPTDPGSIAKRVERRPVPVVRPPAGPPAASIVVPVADNLASTRLALESVLANTEEPAYEVVVVDNGSEDRTRDYLEVLAARNRHVRVIRNESDVGFAAACNQGLEAAAGDLVALLSNDTIVPPGWLAGLAQRLEDPSVGLIGPTTNGFGGAAQISTPYETYEEMLRFARDRADAASNGAVIDIEAAEMSSVALRRSVFREVGPLDDRPEAGMFEDADYARRVREAGYRVVRDEGLFVHQFGHASLASTGNGDGGDRKYATVASRADSGIREHTQGGAPRGRAVALREPDELEKQTTAVAGGTALRDAPPPTPTPPTAEAVVEAESPPPSVATRPAEPWERRWITPVLLGIIVAVGLALRAFAAQGESLYGDELYSYAIATQSSLAGVFDQIEVTENNPPFFYLLAWLIAKLGDPTTLIRLPSVLAGAAAVPVVYLLGKRFGRARAGLIAAALIAVLPFAVFYGTEARAYGLLLFLLPLSTLALLRALDGERRVWWGVYWLAAALALYSHYTAGLVIALQVAWALYAERERWRSILAVNFAVALAFVPWVPMLDNNSEKLPIIGGLHPVTFENVTTSPLRVLFGHPFADAGEVPGLLSLILLALAAAIAILTFAIARGWRSRRSDAQQPSRSLRARREIWLVPLLAIGPPLLALAYSLAATSIYSPRNLTALLPYACVLAAIAVAALPRRAMLAVAALGIVAALLGSVRTVVDYSRPDIRAASEWIESRSPPGTHVVEPLLFRPPPLNQDLAIHLDDRYPLGHDPKDLKRQPRGKEFWVVLPHPDFVGPVAKEAKAADASVTGGANFEGLHDVFVRRYTR
jgi:ATP-binding cassette subfamily B protein